MLDRSLVTLFLAAVPLLETPARAGQEPAPPTLEAAQADLRAGDLAGAAAILRELTAREPENGRAWYLLGYALHGSGDLEAAIAAHERAARFPKFRAGADYNLACAHALRNESDLAFAALDEALAAGFANPQALAGDADLASLRSDPRFAAVQQRSARATFVEDFPIHYEIVGEAAGDRFGWIGRDAGDCDGDGVSELLISAPFKDIGGAAAGRIYVYSGADGHELYRHDGQPGDYLGIGIDGAGDVNGDGVADQIAGSHRAQGTGGAFVYSGVDGKTLLELWGEAPGDAFGRKLAGCGDMDGDGHDDVIVGASGSDAAGIDAGRAYVFSGNTGEPLITLDGEAPGDAFGSTVDGYARGEERLLVVGAQNAGEGQRGRVYVYRVEEGQPQLAFTIDSQPGDVNLGRMFVSVIGDVNGDGVQDVYGSDWESNANGIPGAGRIYIHSGADGSRLYELAGTHPGEGFGIGTCEAGDVDADGRDDFLVGIWQSAVGAPRGGRCELYSGKTGAILQTYTCSTAGDTFGYDTTTVGDVNGDGLQDFLITSAESLVAGPQSGRIFVVSAPDLRPDRAAAAAADAAAQR